MVDSYCLKCNIIVIVCLASILVVVDTSAIPYGDNISRGAVQDATVFYVNIPEDIDVGSEVYQFDTHVILGNDSTIQIDNGNTNDRFVTGNNLTIFVKGFLSYDVTPDFNLTVIIVTNNASDTPVVMTYTLCIEVSDLDTWPPVYNEDCATPISDTKGGPLFECTINSISLRTMAPKLAVDTYNNQCSMTVVIPLHNELAPLDRNSSSFFSCSSAVEQPQISTLIDKISEYEGPMLSEMVLTKDDYYTDVVTFYAQNLKSVEDQVVHCRYGGGKFAPQNAEIIIKFKGCPAGKYGYLCDRNCVCQNGALCHGFNGACKCLPGWKSPGCDIPIPRAVIDVDVQIINAPLRSSQTLNCQIYNIHAPVVSWTRNGSHFDFGVPTGVVTTRRGKLNDGEKSTLIILMLTPKQAGIYQCRAQDSDGKIYYSNTVDVRIKGCLPGYWGDTCELHCDCVNADICDQHDGCVCLPDWKGVHCDNKEQEGGVSKDKSGNYMTTVIASSVTSLLVIVMFIIGLCVYLQVYRKPYQHYTRVPMTKCLAQLDPIPVFEECIRETGVRQISEKCVETMDVIGCGNIATVFKAKLTIGNNTTMVAAKCLHQDYASMNNYRSMCREIEILSLLGDHENVVKLIGVVVSKDACYIIEELMYDNLQAFLNPYRHGDLNRQTDLVLLQFASQVADALSHLERHKIVHRDIAARNVLISPENKAKLGDFGLSRNVYCREVYVRVPGHSEDLVPAWWMALESLTDGINNYKTDIWSFGVLLWEISTLGGFPYSDLGSSEHLIRALRGGYRLPPPLQASDNMYQLMMKCWDRSPCQRPTAMQLSRTLQTFTNEGKGFFRYEDEDNQT